MGFTTILFLCVGLATAYGSKCAEDYFDCGNGKCVSGNWLCDGDNDCGNLRDEQDCDTPFPACRINQFTCESDKYCIPQRWHCDGDKDCEDGSDERNCDTPFPGCPSSWFTCESDKHCILQKWHCDGDKDCEDGSDERNCDTEECAGFSCLNDQCIPTIWRCDGNKDCNDGSDEELCSLGKSCADTEFLCSSGSCVNLTLICDGKNDCIDGTDEGSHCIDHCENSTCSQNCKSTPSGPLCFCNDGYMLDAKDNRTCIDIDECLQEGICSHQCTNTPGGYKCSCLDDYELVNKTCQAKGDDPLLFFSTRKEIRTVSLRANEYNLVTQAVSGAISLDIDPNSQTIFWIELSNKLIMSAKTDGTSIKTVLDQGLEIPEDIAVDYVANNIYLTDSGLRQVMVCKIDGTMCHVLHDKNVEKPRAIVLDLSEGLLYWSDWGEHAAGIYRSGMDGSQRIHLVSNGIKWPNGIAIDHTTDRLYWGDPELQTIEYVTLDGSSRKVVMKEEAFRPFHPYSLAVFEDTIYWSDWSTFTLESCNKFTGHRMTTFAKENSERIMGLHVYHPVLTEKVSNPCEGNPCSHMCLISPLSGFRCACPFGFDLAEDSQTCKIDHCENSTCSQNCRSTPSGPQCFCNDGYMLDAEDNQTCVDSNCDGFYCSASQQCVAWSQVCDGHQDCESLQDEGGLCSMSCHRNNGGCSQSCMKTPHGPRCTCKQGYSLKTNNKTCDDIDECQTVGSCSHYCQNTEGGYKCSCADGYTLQNDHHCKADGGSGIMVYLHGNEVRGYNLDNGQEMVYIQTENENDMKGMDYDPSSDVFFWTREDGSINSYSRKVKERKVILQSSSTPVLVRYDWIAKNIYYVDKSFGIAVCDVDGKYCKTIIQPSNKRIESMAISPTNGLMFFTVWADSMSHRPSGLIVRADMDGSRKIAILVDGMAAPSGITVDHVLKLIYWSDKQLNTIECADFNLSGRRRIVESRAYHPLAVATFEDDVYWTDWNSGSINKCSRFTCEDYDVLIKGGVTADVLMIVHDVMKPNGSNPCLSSPCTHMCLISRNGFRCACPDGFELAEDSQTCKNNYTPSPSCLSSQFACTSDQHCIPQIWHCDGEEDCEDGSDEIECGLI